MGDSIDSAALHRGLQMIAAAATAATAELNAADGALGDGDLGITVADGFAEAARTELPADIGLAFLECAKAFQRVSSSSFGTLVATGFMAVAKAGKGRQTIPAGELASLVVMVRDAMLARGKGQLGDKTVIDSLDAVSKAIGDVPAAQMPAAALAAAEATLEAFRGKACKLGRARMFPEKSKELSDPGQLALVHILRGLAT